MAKGKNETSPSFVLTLPLKVDQTSRERLDADFYSFWRIYNSLVSISTKRWRQLRKTRQYKALSLAIPEAKKNSPERKALYAKRNQILKEAGFSRTGFDKMIKPLAKHFGVNSAIAQTVAERVWKAWNNFLFGKGKEVHYHRFDAFYSFRGKSNATGILCRERNSGFVLQYKDCVIPIVLRNANTNTGGYQREALKNRIKYCTILRQWVKHKWKYYVQIILEGYPPIKADSNGEMKHPIGDGRVGLDIGTQTLAISAKKCCNLKVLAPSALAQTKGLVNEIAKIQRAMDRSRGAMNSKYFNADGTIKKLRSKYGHKQIRKWVYSKNYCKLRSRYRDLNRRLAAIRKQEHYALVNELLQYGDAFFIEDMNYKALQKKSKETKVNTKTGRFRSKKRFGKSLSRCAPATFVTILKQKIERLGGKLTKVDTFNTKASQFDHTDDSYTKKKLSQRFAKLSDGTIVQRDLYSAFLLAHLNKDMKTYNKKTLKSDFADFRVMHEETSFRLKHSTDWLPASVGF